jgi:hypothetical protein
MLQCEISRLLQNGDRLKYFRFFGDINVKFGQMECHKRLLKFYIVYSKPFQQCHAIFLFFTRFEVLTAVKMECGVFWVVVQCNVVFEYHRF